MDVNCYLYLIMAVLWEKKCGGTHYQVRTAGRTHRLYTDGVFHSAFNPRQPVTGDIWDLLALPAFLFSPGQVRRVLLLGVGGGAVIRQLQHFCGAIEVVGVERDPMHLYIAERFFKAAGAGVLLQQDDARTWIKDYSGPPFDLVIDDLFGADKGEPVRAVEADAAWFRVLLRRVSAGGTLAINFGDGAEFERCGYFSDARIRNCFRSAFKTTLPKNENLVGVFARKVVSASRLRRNLLATPEFATALRNKKLCYRIRALI
ncbi:MAG: oxidoreductase [Gammaproteobacteria bacterium]|nr:oxidoreductase [Gammaproteobacteria bacterium]